MTERAQTGLFITTPDNTTRPAEADDNGSHIAMITTIKHSELPDLCAPLAGGFFSGLLNIHGQLHALISAPKAEGEHAATAWGEYGRLAEGAGSFFDGLANTEAMAAAGSAVAKWARGLRIDGCDDWHIPARDQLELLYRNGKPTTDPNVRFSGDNPSSVPPGYPYASDLPAQCANPLFQEGGVEAFEDTWHWSSTQCSAHAAWIQDFGGGFQVSHYKVYEGRVRAVRTILVTH